MPATSQRERNPRGLNAHQRASMVTLFLWQGSKLSDVDVARLCSMSRQGALNMMETISATQSIVKIDGKWQWMPLTETREK